ncbi:MAG: hypothetical protein EPO65_07105 [Dehalococcoidia bacterium]|nr:MAG: hypothetical protein EPO65_07105 [Dehalococcoidia bacterium]
MPTRRRFLSLVGTSAIAAAGGVLIAGCGSKAANPDGPPEIRYGQERCAYCTMSIDDARFASAWRVARTERHFDDIGCMVNASRRESLPSEVRFWVHDYTDEAWLDASQATYVIASAIKTPMAYGVAAFATAAKASSTVPAAKTTLTWTDVLSAVEREG